MTDRDPVDEFKQEMYELIGPVLRKRRSGQTIKRTTDEISDELIEWVVAVRDGALTEAAGVVDESTTLKEASIRINHRRSRR